MIANDIIRLQESVRDQIVVVGTQAMQLNKAGDFKLDAKEKSLMALCVIRQSLLGLEDLIDDTDYATIDDDEFAHIIELASVETRTGKIIQS